MIFENDFEWQEGPFFFVGLLGVGLIGAALLVAERSEWDMTTTDQQHETEGQRQEARQQEQLLEALEDYRRGVADAPYVFKWSVLGAVAAARAEWQGKDAGGGDASMTFVASTEEVDRHGDVVSVSGWKLDAYRKNPVFLWAHDYSRPAIGRSTQVWTTLKETEVTGGEAARGPALLTPGLLTPALLVNVEFAPTGFAQEVAALYRGGYQKGVSVGFRPLRFEERRHPQTGKFLGIRFTEQVLLEVSAAPVPANENAVRRSGVVGTDGCVEARLASLERQVEELRGGYAASGLPKVLEALREARAGPLSP